MTTFIVLVSLFTSNSTFDQNSSVGFKKANMAEDMHTHNLSSMRFLTVTGLSTGALCIII